MCSSDLARGMRRKVRHLLLAVMADFLLLMMLLHIVQYGCFEAAVETGMIDENGITLQKGKGEQEKVVALTFDDGPHAVYTKELLDGLKARGVEATFFLMGSSVEGNEDLIRQMEADGHLIGNHGYRHIQMTTAGIPAVRESVEKTGRIIEGITGIEPEYLRPPYGDWNEELAETMELTPVFWSVDSLDWKYQNAPQITKRVLKKVGDGDIILMHDIFPTSVEAALEIVDTLLAQGYTFVTADELIID